MVPHHEVLSAGLDLLGCLVDDCSVIRPWTFLAGKTKLRLLSKPEFCVQAEGGGYGGGCSIPDNSIDNPSYIIYNPTSNSLSGDVPFAPLAAAWPINLYPFVAVLPNSGSVLVIVGASIGAYVITAGGYTADAAWGAPASLPVPICYPQTATVSLQPLSAANNWAPQVKRHGANHAWALPGLNWAYFPL